MHAGGAGAEDTGVVGIPMPAVGPGDLLLLGVGVRGGGQTRTDGDRGQQGEQAGSYTTKG
jgi:hypothetical protein